MFLTESETDDPARLLTSFEVAELLQVAPKTVRRLAREKRIPCLVVGNEYRFRREAVVGWFAEIEEGG